METCQILEKSAHCKDFKRAWKDDYKDFEKIIEILIKFQRFQIVRYDVWLSRSNTFPKIPNTRILSNFGEIPKTLLQLQRKFPFRILRIMLGSKNSKCNRKNSDYIPESYLESINIPQILITM